ncbi:hypothetical protein ACN2AU_10500 [Aerococcus viridans]
MNKPVISFEGYKITNIDYKSFAEEEEMIEFLEADNFEEIEDNANLAVGVGISDDQAVGNVRLTNYLVEKKNLRIVTIEITGQFSLNTDSPRKFLSENGSAILFPYLRATTSMITSLDNENAIILPTFNFSNTYQSVDDGNE